MAAKDLENCSGGPNDNYGGDITEGLLVGQRFQDGTIVSLLQRGEYSRTNSAGDATEDTSQQILIEYLAEMTFPTTSAVWLVWPTPLHCGLPGSP